MLTEEEQKVERNQFDVICEELGDLYDIKNPRYGGAFKKSFENLGMMTTAVRVSDKCERLVSLVRNMDDCDDESIEDTLRDLANYSIMTLKELKFGKNRKKGEVNARS